MHILVDLVLRAEVREQRLERGAELGPGVSFSSNDNGVCIVIIIIIISSSISIINVIGSYCY